MITVVGSPAWRDAEPAGPVGRACEIAIAAAGRDARVELVGRIGDDPVGDALLHALARRGVGHAAVLRDPGRPTFRAAVPVEPDEVDVAGDLPYPSPVPSPLPGPRLEPADVALGLRYLDTFSVLVVADDLPVEILPVATEAAAFAGARLVVLVPAGLAPPAGLPGDATILAAPGAADDGEFGTLVGAYAAALDQGLDPDAAFRAATGAAGWEAVPVDAG